MTLGVFLFRQQRRFYCVALPALWGLTNRSKPHRWHNQVRYNLVACNCPTVVRIGTADHTLHMPLSDAERCEHVDWIFKVAGPLANL